MKNTGEGYNHEPKGLIHLVHKASVMVAAALILMVGFVGVGWIEIRDAEATPIQFGTMAEAEGILGGDDFFYRQGEECIQMGFGEPEDYDAARWICSYTVYDPVINETIAEGYCEFDNPYLKNEDFDLEEELNLFYNGGCDDEDSEEYSDSSEESSSETDSIISRYPNHDYKFTGYEHVRYKGWTYDRYCKSSTYIGDSKNDEMSSHKVYDTTSNWPGVYAPIIKTFVSGKGYVAYGSYYKLYKHSQYKGFQYNAYWSESSYPSYCTNGPPDNDVISSVQYVEYIYTWDTNDIPIKQILSIEGKDWSSSA